MKDGSYSVEAAIIMPVVIIIMLVFLLFGFYLRDIVFTEAFARNIILVALDDTDESDISMMAGELQGALWCARVRQFSVLDGKNKTVIRYKLTSGFKFLDMPIENTLSSEKEEKTAEKLRGWKVLTDMAKDFIAAGDK